MIRPSAGPALSPTGVTGTPVERPTLAAPGAGGNRSANWMVVLGLVIFGLAVVISLGTYAEARDEGGTYFVLWWPALIGLVLLGVGVSRWKRPGTSSLAQWYRDPTGRHQLRYWDGARWTDRVADGGEQTADRVEGVVAAPAGSDRSGSRAAPVAPSLASSQPRTDRGHPVR